MCCGTLWCSFSNSCLSANLECYYQLLIVAPAFKGCSRELQLKLESECHLFALSLHRPNLWEHGNRLLLLIGNSVTTHRCFKQRDLLGQVSPIELS